MHGFRFGGDVVFGKAFRFGQSGGGPSGPATDPTITAIATNGWEAVSNDASTFDAPYDPHIAPAFVVVPREGFDASGNAVTIDANIPIMTRVREPSPASTQGSPVWTASDTAMQNYVYSGETIEGGATNNSTREFPMPQAMWLDHDGQRTYDQTYTAKLAVSHGHARNGSPVAAVKFIASDGVNPDVTSTVSVMTKTDYTASGLSVPHFEATLDLSSLDDDTMITIDAEIYPWVGDVSYLASVDFATYPSPNFCEMRVMNAVTAAEAPIYAYVDGVGASGGTASTTEGTALADPFATNAAAAAAIVVVDGVNASRGTIKITASTTIIHANFKVAVGDTPLIVEGVNKTTSIYGSPPAHVFDGIPDKIKFKNLTLQNTDDSGVVFIDSGAVGTDPNILVTENVLFDDNGHTTLYSGWVYRVGRWWMIECDGDDVGYQVPAAIRKMLLAIGSGNHSLNTFTYSACGCRDLADVNLRGIGTTADRPTPRGRLFSHNFASSGSGGSSIMEFGADTIDNLGLGLVANVLERTGAESSATLAIFANDLGTTSLNIVRIGNTVIGGRTLIQYNAAGTVSYDQSGYSSFNVHHGRATKTDIFAPASGNRVGNWPAAYCVAYYYNCLIRGDTQNYVYGSGWWMGEVHPLGETNGTVSVPLVVDWLVDASFTGTGAGGGDYRPGASTVLPLIPAGTSAYPYDMNGTAVANDGSAYAGALQQ